MSIPDPTKLIEKGLDTFDDAHYSRGESEADRTSRHLADMQSDNKLSKLIRPLIALIILAVWVALHISSLFIVVKIDSLYSVDAALMAALGFYFSSRGYEKITAKKTAAAIQISKINAKTNRRLSRKRRKHGNNIRTTGSDKP